MSSQNINELLTNAQDEGLLSRASMNAFGNIRDIGAQMQAGLGISADKVYAGDVVLVAQMIDDSGSLRFKGKAQAVRDGHNLVLDEVLPNSKAEDDILALTRYLNGLVLPTFPFEVQLF